MAEQTPHILKCPNCGAPIKPGQKECDYCSSPLTWGGKATTLAKVAGGTAGVAAGATAGAVGAATGFMGGLAAGTINKIINVGYTEIFIFLGLLFHFIDWVTFNFMIVPDSILFDFVIAVMVWLTVARDWGSRWKISPPLAIAFLLEIGILNWIAGFIPWLLENPYTMIFFVKAAWPYWTILGLYLSAYEKEGLSIFAYLVEVGLLIFWIFLLIGPRLVETWGTELPEMTQERLEAEFGQKVEENLWFKRFRCSIGVISGNDYQTCMNPPAPEKDQMVLGEIDYSREKFIDVQLLDGGGKREYSAKKITENQEIVIAKALFEMNNRNQEAEIGKAKCEFKNIKSNEKREGEIDDGGLADETRTYLRKRATLKCTAKPEDKDWFTQGNFEVTFTVPLSKLSNDGILSLGFMYRDQLEALLFENGVVIRDLNNDGTIDYSERMTALRKVPDLKRAIDAILKDESMPKSKCAKGLICPKIGETEHRQTPPLIDLGDKESMDIVTKVTNMKNGKITDLGDVFIYLPPGMEFKLGNEGRCLENYYFTKVDEAQNKYKLDVKRPEFNMKEVTELKKDKDIQLSSCSAQIMDGGRGLFFGSVPTQPIQHDFIVKVENFKYEMELKLNINVMS